jgi:ABC transporter with metal-binding/Fe-S-binding domain ATP-binding protein
LKIVSLFSGGKDSSYALWYAQMQGWEIERLVTVFPESQDSWMFHLPALRWTSLQAESIGIPQVKISTKGIKEEEIEDLATGLQEAKKELGVEAIVSGAVASEYQRTRLDNVCERLGLKSFAPLWHKKQEQLVKDEVEAGFEIIVTACNAMGVDKKWLGRTLGPNDVGDLVKLNKKYGLSIAFEGGEAETFTLSGPIFKRRLSVLSSTPHWKVDSGYLELNDVRLS